MSSIDPTSCGRSFGSPRSRWICTPQKRCEQCTPLGNRLLSAGYEITENGKRNGKGKASQGEVWPAVLGWNMALAALCTEAKVAALRPASLRDSGYVSYSFDAIDNDSVMNTPSLIALEDAAHAAYNLSNPSRRCFGERSNRGIGHLAHPDPAGPRCPGHGIARARIFARATDLDLWDSIRDELLRGQSRIGAVDWEGKIRRHMRLVAGVAAAGAGDDPRPSYLDVPQIGDTVQMGEFTGELLVVLGVTGRVQPPIEDHDNPPEAWEAMLTSMVVVR